MSADMPEDAALKITGKVAKPTGWAEEEVRGLDTIEADYTDKDGEVSTYTGVPLTALLEMVGAQEDATKLVFIADDGYTAEVSLADAQACQDCIVAFRDEGGFSMVMPGFESKLQVKGVIEIQAQ
jgi:hypothetical protein